MSNSQVYSLKRKAPSYLINLIVAIAVYASLQVLISTKVINNYYHDLLILIGINAIMTVSLNLATGLLGELTLGHAGFMAVGAYTAAIFSKSMTNPSNMLIFSLILGGLLAAVFAWLIGIPALRLRGDYLAIVTLAFGEIISIVLRSLKFTGGARGMSRIPRVTTFAWVYWSLIVTLYVIYALIRSRHGRAIISIREDDIAAEASGIDTTRYKALAFGISAFFAGVGGALYAQFQGNLAPEKFNFNYSIDFMVMVVFAGMGSLTGSILSAGILTLLPELLRGLSADFAQYRFLVYAILLILLMIFRPSGLLGQKEISQTVFRNFYRKMRRMYPGEKYLTEQGAGKAPVGGSAMMKQENIPLAGSPEFEADADLAISTRIDSSGDQPLAKKRKGQR